jgi:hypothetical protein
MARTSDFDYYRNMYSTRRSPRPRHQHRVGSPRLLGRLSQRCLQTPTPTQTHTHCSSRTELDLMQSVKLNKPAATPLTSVGKLHSRLTSLPPSLLGTPPSTLHKFPKPCAPSYSVVLLLRYLLSCYPTSGSPILLPLSSNPLSSTTLLRTWSPRLMLCRTSLPSRMLPQSTPLLPLR